VKPRLLPRLARLIHCAISLHRRRHWKQEHPQGPAGALKGKPSSRRGHDAHHVSRGLVGLRKGHRRSPDTCREPMPG
jgi:hypothetical protein